MRTVIQYEDEHILVAYKPAGLAVQTARVAQTDMVSELKKHGKGAYLGVVHRLDQPVEGLLVFGKTKSAAADLAAQLSGGTLHKQYYGVIGGQAVASQGELVDYLRKTPENRAEVLPRESAQAPGVRRAVLEYRVLEERDGLCLLCIRIQTGRFHQIRAQLSHAGMPLLGDMKYGTEQSRQMSALRQVDSVALCACELAFVHPVSGEGLSFRATPQGSIFREFIPIRTAGTQP